MWRSQLLVLLAVASLLMFAACGGGSTVAGPSNDSDQMAVGMILTADDMPGFTGGGGPGCPLGTGIAVPLATPEFSNCAGGSFLTNDAYSGEGRAQIDAQARADGYDPTTLGEPGTTPQPFTPIHGPFILSHHGIFEVYESVYFEPSPERVHEEYLHLTQEATIQEFVLTTTPTLFGDEGETIKRIFGPDSNAYETAYRTIWRRGRVIGDLNTMGSPDLSIDENWRLVTLMDSRMASASGLYDILPTPTPLPVFRGEN